MIFKCSTTITQFNPHNSHKVDIMLCPMKCDTCYTGSLGNLPKVTQLINSNSGIWTPIVWLLSLDALPRLHCLFEVSGQHICISRQQLGPQGVHKRENMKAGYSVAFAINNYMIFVISLCLGLIIFKIKNGGLNDPKGLCSLNNSDLNQPLTFATTRKTVLKISYQRTVS